MKKKMNIKKLILCTIITFCFLNFRNSDAQVPQGFNYQAVARDGSGNPIAGTTIQVILSVLADTSANPAILWEELHNPVKTNAFGLFGVVLGSGVKQNGSAAEFGSINWTAGQRFVRTQIYYQGLWKHMGYAKLWSVPYAMVAGDLKNSSRLQVSGNPNSNDSILFEVKNRAGQTIFAVYEEGVRIYVDDGTYKGKGKGGFAIGGFGTAKAPSQEFFRVTSDSTRVYVNSAQKGTKGGFAIGGFDKAKAGIENFLNLTPSNYFIGHNSGMALTTGLYNSSLGFESGFSVSSGESNAFMGYQSGYNNTSGSSNLFLGYKTGFSNTAGSYNTFVGFKAGYSNTGGVNNSFLGSFAGQNNKTGNYNIFAGDSSGFNNTIGENNSFIGTKAGFSNVSGYSNAFIGNYTGHTNTTGSENVFIGNFSGYSNLSSWGNVLIGNRAGFLSKAGWNNVFLGTESGYNNLAGEGNVFIGYKAGINNISGTRNIFIGNYAGGNQQGSNRLIIDNFAGDSSQVFIWGNMESKLLRLNTNVGIGTNPDWRNLSIYQKNGRASVNLRGTGDTYDFSSFSLESEQGSIFKNYTISHGMTHLLGISYYDGTNWYSRLSIDSVGRICVGTYDPATEMLDINGNARFRAVASGEYSAPLNITGNGTLTTSTSDISMKTNIVPVSNALQKVLEMNSVYFSWKNDPLENRRLGFIAQEMENVLPEVVFTNPVDGLKGINYSELTAVLAQAIKEQQQIIETQQEEINKLKFLENEVSELKAIVKSLSGNNQGNGIKLPK